jgi:tagatose kinase
MKKIVTIGEILVEIMATERGEGFREPLHLVGPFPSGAPAIFIDQAAKLGQPSGIVSCVGDDDFGRLNLDRLRSDGADVTGIAVDPEAATGSAFVRYRQDGGRDFVFNIKHSACGHIALNDAATALIASSDHLHVMGTSLFSPSLVAATRKAIGLIKRRGGTVSFDPNVRQEMLGLPGMREALESIFAQCDLFLPSGPELFLFTKASSEEEAIGDILRCGVRYIVVKHGAEGAVYYDATSTVRHPAFTVEEIDPTGAGDCFGATFVSCWLRGLSPGDALSFAAASGALAVAKQGPMEGTSNMAELDAFIAGTKMEAIP